MLGCQGQWHCSFADCAATPYLLVWLGTRASIVLPRLLEPRKEEPPPPHVALLAAPLLPRMPGDGFHWVARVRGLPEKW